MPRRAPILSQSIMGRGPIAARRIATAQVAASSLPFFAPDPDASAWLGKAGSAPDAYRYAFNKWISRLKSSGAWDAMVAGYCYAAPTTAGALNELKGDATRTATTPGTITPFQGFNALASTVTFPNIGGASFVSGVVYNVWAGLYNLSQMTAERTAAGFGQVTTDAANIPNLGIPFVAVSPTLSLATGRGPTPIWPGPTAAVGKAVLGDSLSGFWVPYTTGPVLLGGGGFNSPTAPLRILPNWPLSIPRHCVWLLMDKVGATFTNPIMQAAVDVTQDFCNDIGCLN